MADDDQFGSGVASVFDAIASERRAAPAPSAPVPAKRPRKSPLPPGTALPPGATTPPNDQQPAERPAARTGRFPGAKNGPRKEQITARITPDLKDAFVKWSLDDRCPVQNLFERALIEFYQRYRATAENDQR